MIQKQEGSGGLKIQREQFLEQIKYEEEKGVDTGLESKKHENINKN